MNQPNSDKTVAARPGEALDAARLNDYLRDKTTEIGQIIEISQFPGGYSNLTYCISTSTKDFVLRCPPHGANIKSAHDMGREFRVLSLLKDHYKLVPQPIIYCDSSEVIGSPFYIMEKVAGIILRTTNAVKLNLAPELHTSISESIIDNLVALHAIDIHETDLIQLGKPEGYVTRQVEGWIKRYYNSETDKLIQMDETADWLKRNIPLEQPATFLHNDYKHDNVVLHSTNLSRIVAVLDWEMSTVGDPLMDLGASLAYWAEAGDDDAMKQFNLTWLPGNLTRREVIERYALKSGRNVSNILFYYVFGLYKNAVIAQQIYARWKQGLTKDPRFGQLWFVIKSLSERTNSAVENGVI